MNLFVFLFLLLCSFFANTEDLSQFSQKNFSKLEIIDGTKIYKEDNYLFFGVEINLKDGWKTYWKNPGDAGAPITLDFKNKKDLLEHKIFYPPPKRYIDEGIETIGYEKKVIFPVRIKLNSNNNIKVKVSINYLICKNICIPLKEEKIINLPKEPKPSKDYTLKQILDNLPKRDSKNFQLEKTDILYNGDLSFVIKKSSKLNNPSIFVYSPKNKYSQEILTKDDKIFLNLKPSKKSSTDFIELLIIDEYASKEFFIDLKSKSQNINFLKILFLAFIGGIILNFMPCVLPILSLKIYSFIKLQDNGHTNTPKLCLFTILGIMFSFIALAFMAIVFKFLGKEIGWGMHFQSETFLFFFSILLLFFSLNLLGFFEIFLPDKILKSLQSTSKNEYKNAFFTGTFATLLATPCSAPFLGTAIGFAFSQSNFSIMITFIILSMGFALPYIILMFSPKIINFFPKPGRWMNYLKFFLGLLVLLSSLWLFSMVFENYKTIFIIFLLISSLSLNKLLGKKKIFLQIILPIFLFSTFWFSFNEDKNSWLTFEENKLSNFVKNNNLILVDITADWCITCQVNKFTTLNRENMISFLERNDVILFQADWTDKNDDILNYMKSFNRFGVPLNIVYGPKNKKGVVLSEILSEKIIKAAIQEVSENVK